MQLCLPLHKDDNFKYLKHRHMNTVDTSNPVVATVSELILNFNPETANKKQIRELRKALAALKNEKYPKGAKKAKVAKAVKAPLLKKPVTQKRNLKVSVLEME